jgi:hypothetical protein
MALPTIRKPTVAPNRAMARDVYPVVADQWAASIGPFTDDLIVAISWMGQQVTDVADYKDQAIASAKAAAKSVEDAAVQVKLATDQATASRGYSESAASTYASMQVLAGALQSAAGLPAMDGKLGYFMQVGFDGRVRWQKLQSIGDVITSVAPPDSSWIPDSARYAQSLYPELFAKVGITATDDTLNLSKYNATIVVGASSPSGRQYTFGKNGVVLCASYQGYIFRSTDSGITWNDTATAFYANGQNPIGVAYDPINETFIFICNQGAMYRSTDQGVTWTKVATLPGNWNNYSLLNIINAGSKNWFITSTSDPGNIAQSTDGGLTWTLVKGHGNGANNVKWLTWDGTYLYGHLVNNIGRSSNLGDTWDVINVPAPYLGGGQAGGPLTMGKIGSNGKALIFGLTYSYQIGNNVYQHWGFYYSTDNLNTLTWIPVSPIQTVNNTSLNMNPGDLYLDRFGVALMPEINRANWLWRVSGVGVPGKAPVVDVINSILTGSSAGTTVTSDNQSLWLVGFNNNLKRITPAYDPKTFFALPRITPCEPPFNNYVKAKLQ